MNYDDITKELVQKDLMLMQSSHDNGNIWIEDNSNTGINRDIVNSCVDGICRYNRLTVPYRAITRSNNLTVPYYDINFINYVIDNLEMFLEHGNIPSFMQEYYIDVLNRGNVNYLNNYLLKHGIENEEGRGKGIGAYTKSTPAGRAFSERDDSAFASVLILPAMLALVYISVVVIYFVFFYNGG